MGQQKSFLGKNELETSLHTGMLAASQNDVTEHNYFYFSEHLQYIWSVSVFTLKVLNMVGT